MKDIFLSFIYSLNILIMRAYLLPRSLKVILNDILRFSYIKYFLFFFKFWQSTNQYSKKLSVLFHYHKYLICEIYFLNSLGYSLPCL